MFWIYDVCDFLMILVHDFFLFCFILEIFGGFVFWLVGPKAPHGEGIREQLSLAVLDGLVWCRTDMA